MNTKSKVLTTITMITVVLSPAVLYDAGVIEKTPVVNLTGLFLSYVLFGMLLRIIVWEE